MNLTNFWAMSLIENLRWSAAAKEKKAKAELIRLTKIDAIDGGRKPIYQEIAASIVGVCADKALKKKEIIKALDKKLAGSKWENLRPISKAGYLSAHLRYLKSKGEMKSEGSRWSSSLALTVFMQFFRFITTD